MARFFASFLAGPHILLKPVQRPSFLLILRKGLRPFVKFSINELSGVHNITQSLSPDIIDSRPSGMNIEHLVMKDIRADVLLKLKELEALKILFSDSPLIFILEIIFLDQVL